MKRMLLMMTRTWVNRMTPTKGMPHPLPDSESHPPVCICLCDCLSVCLPGVLPGCQACVYLCIKCKLPKLAFVGCAILANSRQIKP